MDEMEMEVAQILLQLPRLVYDSEIRSMFPFSWRSKKRRTTRKFSALSNPKTTLPSPNLKVRIPLKRKRPEEDIHHQNSLRSGSTKGKFPFCAAKKEESSSKGKDLIEASNSRTFLLPDLNLPALGEEEEVAVLSFNDRLVGESNSVK